MNFFRTIKDSIYHPEFYQGIAREGRLGSAWGYYTKLSVIAVLLVTFMISLLAVPSLNRFLGSLRSEILNIYPDELALTFENGTVKSNVTEPYYIDLPERWKNELSPREQQKFAHLVVIDTNNTFTPELFEAYQTGAWIMRDRIAFQDDNGFRVQNFSDVEYKEGIFVFDETKLTSLLDAAQPLLRFVPALLVLGLFVGFLMLYGFSILSILFSALFAFLLGKILKKDWSYKTSLTLSFYAATLPFILYHVTLPFSLAFGPLVFMVILLLVLIVNFGWDKPRGESIDSTAVMSHDLPISTTEKTSSTEEKKETP